MLPVVVGSILPLFFQFLDIFFPDLYIFFARCLDIFTLEWAFDIIFRCNLKGLVQLRMHLPVNIYVFYFCFFKLFKFGLIMLQFTSKQVILPLKLYSLLVLEAHL